MESTTWTLTLVDATSPKAEKIVRGLGGVEKGLAAVDRQAQRTTRTLAGVGEPRAGGASGFRRGGSAAGAAGSEADRVRRTVERIQAQQARAAERSQLASGRFTSRMMQRAFRDTQRHNAQLLREGERAQKAAQRQSLLNFRAHAVDAGSVLSGITGALGTIGGIAAGVLATAASIGAAFGGIALAIGRSVLEMIQFREASVTTLGVLMGGRGGAEIGRIGGQSFRQGQAIARATPADERGVIELQRQSASYGFDTRGRAGSTERDRAFAASLDVQALNASDPTAASRFLLQLGQLRNSATPRMSDLTPLAATFGSSSTDILRRAAGSIGVTQRAGESDRSFQGRLDSARSSGRITGRMTAEAALAELSAKTGMGAGGFAAERGNSFSGAISNLESSVFGLVTSIEGLEQLPGVQRLRDTFFAVGNAINGSTGAGQRLQRLLTGIIDGVTGRLGAALSPEGVERGMNRILDLATRLMPVVRTTWGTFVQGLRSGAGPLSNYRDLFSAIVGHLPAIGRGLGWIVGFSVRIVSGFVALGAAIAGIVGWVSSSQGALRGFFTVVEGLVTTNLPLIAQGFGQIGTAIVNGIIGGLRSAWGSLISTLHELAAQLPAPVRRVLEIRSPSRVFRDQVGRQIPAGIEMGIDAGAPSLARSIARVASPPGGAGAAGRSGGSGSPLIGQLSITVEGASTNEGTAQAVADAIEGILGRLQFAGA